jgi:hypothetical protein
MLRWVLLRRAGAEGICMRGWMSQIVIGIIVTVVGTVIANAIVGGSGRHVFGGSHFSGPARGGR